VCKLKIHLIVLTKEVVTMVNEPFNRHASNDGKIRFGSVGYATAADAESGPLAAAVFTDGAGNEVGRLTRKEMEARLAGKKLNQNEAEIPREMLALGIDRIHDFEQRLFRIDIPSP
jgi:hypothetical protein